MGPTKQKSVYSIQISVLASRIHLAPYSLNRALCNHATPGHEVPASLADSASPGIEDLADSAAPSRISGKRGPRHRMLPTRRMWEKIRGNSGLKLRVQPK
eukprot:gnl/TRDRNA2_/TRDRNA2_134689_c1_seq1.p2 gnl/TRDRNA2_/TRDRNA2_134689_c1~~gnl/TRDRNA2_/TRDRNA2_134689_c1_seq1.p2  ORF type:complete len:100 (+),score=4.53 gnl/TRDRNA2_/TRDRNA2_134689_c1_seq1:60-359(+)